MDQGNRSALIAGGIVAAGVIGIVGVSLVLSADWWPPEALRDAGIVQKQVGYDLAADPAQCQAPDETGWLEVEGTRMLTCIWNCASYAGESRRTVQLQFVSEGGGPWTLYSEMAIEGICTW